MLQNNLAFSLDCLRLATLYSVPPHEVSSVHDDTPVTFTMANKKVLTAVPLNQIPQQNQVVKIDSPIKLQAKSSHTDASSNEDSS